MAITRKFKIASKIQDGRQNSNLNFSVLSHLWPLPGLSLKFGTNQTQNDWNMSNSRKSKIASKIQDGRQNMKIFSFVTSLTPTRLKLKIWYQSDLKWLKYGHLKKIQDGFQKPRFEIFQICPIFDPYQA